jgi:hypothetical protein
MDEAAEPSLPQERREAPAARAEGDGERLAIPPGLGPLLTEIADLKRVRCEDWPGQSLADALFRRACADVAAGADADGTAAAHIVFAAAHTRLGPVDWSGLGAAGLDEEERRAVYRRAATRALGPLAPAEAEALGAFAEPQAAAGPLPAFADVLADVRWIEPAADEPHDPAEDAIRFGEHAWCVAAMAAVIERARGEPPGAAFLLGLLHHVPDLAATWALAEPGEGLPEEAEASAGALLARRHDTGWPAGHAFNAADGIDAVVERRHAVNRAGLSLSDALGPGDLAPPGPMRDFHTRVLRSLGLSY